MAPDGERTSRKPSGASSSTTVYSVANNISTRSQMPANKSVLQKQSRQPNSAMATKSKGPSSSSLSTTTTTPIYSLATTKAVKPRNKTVGPKPPLTLQQQQKQKQQQQMQQIRAIRRKRTVAFAVNHERVSQPHAACVVSADAAPDRENSSSAQSRSTRDTVLSTSQSTVTRDPTFPSRASPAIRDCSCTFQESASGFGEDFHVEDYTNRSQEKELSSSHQRPSHAERSLSSKESQSIKSCETNHNTTEKKPKQNNRLVVDVRCAEEAAAAAISNDVAQATNCDVCRSAPVPVTPTYLAPCVNELNATIVNKSSKRQRVEGPSEKQRSFPNQGKEAVASIHSSRPSELPSKLSKKPKIKRVRYDMECVPPVEMNRDLWGQVGIRFRTKSQCDKTISNKMNGHAQPPSNPLLKGSVLWIPSSREEWEDCVSEMKGVCTSAAFRRWSKIVINDYENTFRKIHHNNNSKQAVAAAQSPASSQDSSTTMKSFHPPLSQAFIKDRIRIDDPLRGYQIRHAKGGWLQGFLVWTNFTVWTLDFQWDSNHPASGLPHHDGKSDEAFGKHDDGRLSKELQALPRGEQDPLDGGIVLKQVAEISLLGGLGCGELLLRKAIEDIRKSKNSDNCKYKYIVLQATEGSRKFYEKMGFVRVGAVCRYRWAEYCTNGNGSATAGKKQDVNKVQVTDVDPKFHGYRHWTYTNESSKSLNAHGGPSVMMCLKLDDYGKESGQQENRQSVSELLEPHLVHAKPTIQLFGNVANPDSENVAPTRKSQRRCSSSSGSLRGMRQEQQEQSTKSESESLSSIRELEAGGLASANTLRRTSNRSKRGQNTSLANSCYVLYGVEGGRNISNKSFENSESGNNKKRKRRSSKISSNPFVKGKDVTKDNLSRAVIVAPSVNNCDASIFKEGSSSTNIQANDQGLAVSGTSANTSSKTENSSTEVLPLSSGELCNPKKFLTACAEKNTENMAITVAPHQDNKSSQKRKNSIFVCADHSKVSATRTIKHEMGKAPISSGDAKNSAGTEILDNSDENSTKSRLAGEIRLETIQQQLVSSRGIFSGADAQERGDGSNILHTKDEKSKDSSLKNETNESGKTNKPIREANTKNLTCASLTPRKDDKIQRQRALVHHDVTRSSHLRKRSRQPAMRISASKLFKQKAGKKPVTNCDFYNQIVIRRNVQNIFDQDYNHHISKKRRDNDNSKKGKFRWRYNGGLMIDHRYEFCFYFVLEYNELNKSMTIVPIIKDGVFERAAEGKTSENIPTALEKHFLGRPRYQCNILETDKNWIRDVALEDYVIVKEAIPVFNTALVAQEAWDIGGNGFPPRG